MLKLVEELTSADRLMIGATPCPVAAVWRVRIDVLVTGLAAPKPSDRVCVTYRLSAGGEVTGLGRYAFGKLVLVADDGPPIPDPW